jgi:hypothetical protein
MKKTILALMAFTLIFASGCNSGSSNSGSKGELGFLLGHAGKLPSDVGFLTNQIIERRLANLLKENLAAFKEDKTVCEMPILVIDSNLVVARYKSCEFDNQILRNICIDVAQDAIWISQVKDGKASIQADHSKLPMPKELMIFKVY